MNILVHFDQMHPGLGAIMDLKVCQATFVEGLALELIQQKINLETKTNTLRTLFQPFLRNLNNILGSASLFNRKRSLVNLEQK